MRTWFCVRVAANDSTPSSPILQPSIDLHLHETVIPRQSSNRVRFRVARLFAMALTPSSVTSLCSTDRIVIYARTVRRLRESSAVSLERNSARIFALFARISCDTTHMFVNARVPKESLVRELLRWIALERTFMSSQLNPNANPRTIA